MPRRYNRGAGIAGAIMKGLGSFADSAMTMRQQAAQRLLSEQNAVPSDIRSMDIVGMPRTPQNLLNLRTAGATNVRYDEGGEKVVTRTPGSGPQPDALDKLGTLENKRASGQQLTAGEKAQLRKLKGGL